MMRIPHSRMRESNASLPLMHQSEAAIYFERTPEVAARAGAEGATGAFLIKNGLVYQYSTAPASDEQQTTPEQYTVDPIYAATMDDMIVRLKYKGKMCRKRAAVYLDCTDLDVSQPEFLFRAKYRTEQDKWELLGGFTSFSTLDTQDASVFQLSADTRHSAGWTAYLDATVVEA
ncbi:hypothetical protein EXIGLDRAFT_343661 [Exidia glandulosa HHB12029]|uniref:Uncharacterized protein n=1 Tax=Exidia glandulosa HHB12029 TaxID=1314781 RepID=A0A165LII1_EXIGL|nr:hypothetical protein EXIGLDRAFT_343661 [Exidia glandulosa HHB12029]